MMAGIGTKRVYEPAEPSDGKRVLVDRLWPRGLSRQQLALDAWLKDIAPSDGLRKWFAHDPSRWEDFKRRYVEELSTRPDVLAELLELLRDLPVTLLYSARDEAHNNAVALKEFIERQWR